MGGRKKASKKVAKKKRTGLRSVFKCVQCNNDGVVECVIRKEAGTGEVVCRVCGASFICAVNYLSKPIDVYCEWIDECERISGEQEKVEGDEGEEEDV
ncbi:transcription elongation factor 1 [Nannochloropsis oceanica]